MSSANRFSIILVAATLLVTTGTAHAQLRFRLTPITNSDVREFEIAGLNDKGEIVGYIGSFGGRAYLWKNGTYVDLAPRIDPHVLYTETRGINNRSFIVGIRGNSDYFWRGFLLPPQGQRIDIVLPTDRPVFIGGVNNRNQVIGMTDEGRPFVWRDGLTKWLSEVPGTNAFSYTNNINNLGTIVGTSGPVEAYRAVIWKGSTVTDLGVLSGDNRSEGRDINDSDQVVGSSISPESLHRAFLWSDGQLTELPSLHGPAGGSTAHGINNWGAAIGASYAADNRDFRATLWINGQALDLSSLVAKADPLQPYVTFEQTYYINNRGQIVAAGRDSREPNVGKPYLLTPTY